MEDLLSMNIKLVSRVVQDSVALTKQTSDGCRIKVSYLYHYHILNRSNLSEALIKKLWTNILHAH